MSDELVTPPKEAAQQSTKETDASMVLINGARPPVLGVKIRLRDNMSVRSINDLIEKKRKELK